MLRMTIGVALIALAATACGGSGGSGEQLSLSQWAARVCAIAEEREAADSVGGDVDPSTLSLEDRKERADEVQAEVAAIFSQAASDMRAIEPPSQVRDYHVALSDGYQAIADALAAAREEILNATSHENIEAANADLNIAFTNAGSSVEDAIESLDSDAVAALQGVTNCGSIT